MRRSIAAAVAAVALVAPAAAGAHVTVQPSTVPAGGFTRLDVRVPNERDDKGTVKIDVKLPPGFIFASYEPVPGWKVDVQREQLAEPVETEDGFEVDEQIGRITWTGEGRDGVIAPGQFQDFGLSVAVPDGKPGDELTFKALQTYQGGEVVRWIGPPDSEEPAAMLTLAASGEGGGHGAPPAAGETESDGAAPAAPAAPAAAAADDGGDGLAIAALVVGVLGLLAGLAALLTIRRRSIHTTPAQEVR